MAVTACRALGGDAKNTALPKRLLHATAVPSFMLDPGLLSSLLGSIHVPGLQRAPSISPQICEELNETQKYQVKESWTC